MQPIVDIGLHKTATSWFQKKVYPTATSHRPIKLPRFDFAQFDYRGLVEHDPRPHGGRQSEQLEVGRRVRGIGLDQPLDGGAMTFRRAGEMHRHVRMSRRELERGRERVEGLMDP